MITNFDTTLQSKSSSGVIKTSSGKPYFNCNILPLLDQNDILKKKKEKQKHFLSQLEISSFPKTFIESI